MTDIPGGESGFQLGSAFVSVYPDASDFVQELDEEVGGLAMSVKVTPDASDFAAAVDEQVGGLSVSIPVTANTTEATTQLDAFIENAEATSLVLTLGIDTDEALGQVDAFVADAEAEIASIGDAPVIVSIIPDMGDFDDALAEGLGGGGTVSVAADGEESVEGLAAAMDGLTGSTEGATEALDAFDGEMAGSGGAISTLSAEINELSSNLDGLAEGFGASIAGHLGALSGIGDELQTGLSKALANAGNDMVISVSVVPEMDDFADAVQEAAGGVVASVDTLPSMGDFADAVDEEAGGVRAQLLTLPDMSAFEESAQEQADAMSVTLRVVPEDGGDSGLAGTGAQVDNITQSSQEAEDALAGLDTTLKATAADGAALGEVTEELDTLAIAAAAATQPMETLRELTADSFGSVDYSAATQALAGVASAEEQAAAEAGSLQADLAELQSEMAALDSEAVTLDSQFLAWANSGSATEEQMLAIGEQMENLRNSISGTAAEMTDYSSALASGNADMAAAETQLGTFASDIRSAESALGEATETVTTASAEFSTLSEMAARLNVSMEDLPEAWQAMDAALASSAAQGEASIAALNGEATAMDAIGGAAATAEEGVSGLSLASGSMAGMLVQMFSDPLTIIAAFTAAVGVAGVKIADYENSQNDLISTMQKQDQATGMNITGYEQLSDQLSGAAGHTTAVAIANQNATTSYESMHDGINNLATAIPAVTAAQQAAQDAADNLSSHLGTLENQYDLTQAQAEQLATAAGVSAKQLDSSGTSANDAMGKIEAYANANESAQGPVGELSNDMSTFSNSALTASTRVNALDQAYDLLVGNFVTAQQATLSVSQDFLTISSNAQQAGASMTGTNSASTTLQQSFYSTIPAIEQAANAMVKQGDSTNTVTGYINTQVDKLSGLAGGNQQAEQAVQGLKQWEDELKSSTDGMNSSAQKAATTLQNDFTSQVESAGVQSSTAQGDIGNLATAILGTGTSSSQTATDRAQLIKDLENAGVSAYNATQDVDGFIGKLAAIPSSTNVNLYEQATGVWTIQEALTGTTGIGGILPTPTGHATGGLIRGGSGLARADDIPALLSDREYVIQAPAVEKYGAGLFEGLNSMKYATGGLVGSSYSGTTASGLGDWVTSEYNANTTAFTTALEAAVPKQPGYAYGGLVQIPHYASGGSVWDAASAGAAYGRESSNWAAIENSAMQGMAINGTSMPYATGAAARNISVNFNGITSFPNPEQIQAIQLALSAAVGVS